MDFVSDCKIKIIKLLLYLVMVENSSYLISIAGVLKYRSKQRNFSGLYQRWLWIRSDGVDSGRILRFSFGRGVKIL